MHQIIIIGTVPPCSRCRLLTEIVRARVSLLKLDAKVRHISYTSEEALELAAKAGLRPGTAKEVSKLIGVAIDVRNMPKAAVIAEADSPKELEPELSQLEGLFREVNLMDQWLRPFEEQAAEAGILMTPTLIIDGSIKHSGSVPGLAAITRWLSELD